MFFNSSSEDNTMVKFNYEVYKSSDDKLVVSLRSPTMNGLALEAVERNYRASGHTSITSGSFEMGDTFGTISLCTIWKTPYWYIENANRTGFFNPEGLERFLELPEA